MPNPTNAHRHKDHRSGRSIDILAAFLETAVGRSSLHWGYWDDPDHVYKVTLEDMARAGDRYNSKLADAIPSGVRTVLDIGCGTGELSKLLSERGYRVEAINPSEMQCAMAERKVPQPFKVHCCTFEDYEPAPGQQFDCAIFSESFQYVDVPAAMQKLSKFAKHVIVMDYFKKSPQAKQGGGFDWRSFEAAYPQHGFALSGYENVTENVKPNYIFKHKLYNDLAIPLAESLISSIRQDHPVLTRLFGRFLRKRVLKVERFREKARRTADPDNFGRWCEYALIVLDNRSLALGTAAALEDEVLVES